MTTNGMYCGDTVCPHVAIDSRGNHHATLKVGEIASSSWLPNTSTAYLLYTEDLSNWGHMFSETVIPMFALMTMADDLDISSRNRYLFLDEYLCKKKGHEYAQLKIFADRCNKNTKILRYIAQHIYHRGNTDRPVCVKKMIAGSGYMSPWSSMYVKFPYMSGYNILFRNWMYKRFDLVQNPHDITYIVKTGRRTIYNTKNVVRALRNYSFHADVFLNVIKLEELTLIRQIQILSQTKVLITVAGSSAFSHYMLPSTSALLLLPFCGDTGMHTYQYGCRSEKPIFTMYPRNIIEYNANIHKDTILRNGYLDLIINTGVLIRHLNTLLNIIF